MEYETDDANKNWLDRVKESPRTVSALIIVLIVVAAIYAFSGDRGQQPEQAAAPEGTSQPAQEQASPTPVAIGEKTGEQAPGGRPAGQAGTAVSKESLQTAAESLPKAEKTDKGYQEVAERGNGLTHLARRATARYLAENTVSYTITNEHRIYIEDYIKDQLGKKRLVIGQSELISFDLLAEAVESASRLTDKQLRNLTKYTHVLD